MDYKDVIEKLQESPELKASLKAALDRNATDDEIAAILAGAGLDVEDVELLRAEYQRKRGEAIAVQQLDDGELEQVAGGGTGVDCASSYDCDNHFKQSKYFDDKHCDYETYCDELFEAHVAGGRL